MSSEPRETARQIAEKWCRGQQPEFAQELTETITRALVGAAAVTDHERTIASLTADLAQARQEKDAAIVDAQAYSEQSALVWADNDRLKRDLAAAEQARGEALKEAQHVADKLQALAKQTAVMAQSAARTALLEAAEEDCDRDVCKVLCGHDRCNAIKTVAARLRIRATREHP